MTGTAGESPYDRLETALEAERANFKPGAEEWAWALGTIIDNTRDGIVLDLKRSANANVHIVTVQHILALEALNDFVGVVITHVEEFRKLYAQCRKSAPKKAARR
jgi:hypothetical protein